MFPTVRDILEANSINLKSAIYSEIDMLCRSRDRHTHVAFLLDKSNSVLSYKSNVYFKTKSFPFSQHAEINAIVNYYSRQNSKKVLTTSKRLLVIKLGKDCVRMSKPCRQCASFIANNWDNLKLKEVLYSNYNGELSSLSKQDLLSPTSFCVSSASRLTLN